jgi:hypothetical protein
VDSTQLTVVLGLTSVCASRGANLIEILFDLRSRSLSVAASIACSSLLVMTEKK